VCLPSVYLTSPHAITSHRPPSLYLHTASNQRLEVGIAQGKLTPLCTATNLIPLYNVGTVTPLCIARWNLLPLPDLSHSHVQFEISQIWLQFYFKAPQMAEEPSTSHSPSRSLAVSNSHSINPFGQAWE